MGKMLISKTGFVKILMVLVLLALFSWWGGRAMERYLSQPLATDIGTIFGDSDAGIRYPMITFCPKETFLAQNKILKDCGHGQFKYLIPALVECLQKFKEFKIGPLMDSLQSQKDSIFEMVQIWNGTDYISLQNVSDQIWSTVFNPYGTCHTFDLTQVKELEFVRIGTGTGIEFVFTDDNPYENLKIILHSKYDLPDADLLNGLVYSTVSKTKKIAHRINFAKTISKRVATRRIPCTQYEYKTCLNIEDNRMVIDKFNCQIPILYHGRHLDNIIPPDLFNCSEEVTKEAFDLILRKQSKCTRSQACETTRFALSYLTEKTWLENKTVAYFQYKYPEVIHSNTYVSYGIISLIGEVGGFVGLTLGASILSLFESSMLRCISFFESKNKNKETQKPIVIKPIAQDSWSQQTSIRSLETIRR